MRRPALTMIELLVVVGILAVAATPGLLAMRQLRLNQALSSSVEELAGVLRQAHIYAREGREEMGWGVRRVNDRDYELVSGGPGSSQAEVRYNLKPPAVFAGGNWEVWFDQGTGGTGEEENIEVEVGSGMAEVNVKMSGLVEVR